MKKTGIFIIFLSVLSIFVYSILMGYEKRDVEKVYKYLAKKWVYYDINGKKIRVKSLRFQGRGSNYKIIVNGKSLNPAKVYNKSGFNIVDPGKRNKAKPKKIKGKEKGLMKGITEAHNKYRRKTGGGLPELVWDKNMAAYAQKWANYLKRTNGCRMKHRRGSYKKRRYGENLAWSGGGELEPDDVVGMWYREIKDYDYKTNTCSGMCGHYTQVIWKTTKKLGCAMAKCGNDEVWVCNYSPPGNIVGRRPY